VMVQNGFASPSLYLQPCGWWESCPLMRSPNKWRKICEGFKFSMGMENACYLVRIPVIQDPII